MKFLGKKSWIEGCGIVGSAPLRTMSFEMMHLRCYANIAVLQIIRGAGAPPGLEGLLELGRVPGIGPKN